MALAVTITLSETTDECIHYYGTIVASGNYSTGGDTLSWTGASYGAGQDGPKSTQLPVTVSIRSSKGNTAAFQYQYTDGTTNSNGKMSVFTGAAAQSGLAELSAGAYPAGITGDTIRFEAVFPKF